MIKINSIIFLLVLLISTNLKAQQYNTDNYLTMPYGTGTFVLVNGERNAAMFATFALLPKFELNFQTNLYWPADSPNSSQYYSINVFGKYMFWVNNNNTGGAAIFLGVGKSPSYYSQNQYSATHQNYWTAVPVTIPLFNNTLSWDIMPGALVDFAYNNNTETAWGFTWSSRLAIYKIIPKTAIIGEIYGTEGQAYSAPEYKVGLRWEPNDYIVPAISYGASLDGSKGSGFEIGIIIFTPQYLKKDFIKNNKIEY